MGAVRSVGLGWLDEIERRANEPDLSNRLTESGVEYPATGLVEYVFPLRVDLNVRLILPRDLTRAEVQRLERFMMALVEKETKEVQP